MTAICFSIVPSANLRKEQTSQPLRIRRNYLRSNFAVVQKVRDKFPVKTAAYLSELTGFPLRTCEYWLSKEVLPSEAVWCLLQSEIGMEILLAGMGDAKPSWWARIVRIASISSVMRRREADLRLIKKTLRADNDLTAAIARATSMSFSDEEFHRPYLDALGSMDGAPDSAMAGSSKSLSEK